MSEQRRLEALKLAVSVGGDYSEMLSGAARFARFIETGEEMGVDAKWVESPSEPEIDPPAAEDLPQTGTRRRPRRRQAER
ncbi:MAG: hypothetical protein ABGX63_02595 [bacterium]